MRRLELVPVVDLCHFGVPDWLGSFQNPEFPRHFAAYARAFAERYPWVRFYTPVNEMYVAAQFSAYYGWWNERLATHRAFVTALKHLVRANVDGMLAIIPVRPDAIFIQSESSEYFHTTRPELQPAAAFFNERRFLTLDLNYGHPVSADMLEYLLDNGADPGGVRRLHGRRPAGALHHGQRLLRLQRARHGGRGAQRVRRRHLRLLRGHPRLLRPLQPAGDAHRDEHGRAGRGALAVEDVGQRAAPAPGRRARWSA